MKRLCAFLMSYFVLQLGAFVYVLHVLQSSERRSSPATCCHCRVGKPELTVATATRTNTFKFHLALSSLRPKHHMILLNEEKENAMVFLVLHF